MKLFRRKPKNGTWSYRLVPEISATGRTYLRMNLYLSHPSKPRRFLIISMNQDQKEPILKYFKSVEFQDG